MKSAVTEIHQAIENYVEGYLRAEVPTLLKAFHPNARLFASEEGRLDKTELSDWTANLELRKSKGDLRKADLSILNVDVSGGAAVAKIKLSFPTFAFTDYLSFLQLEEGWRIVNKIYTVENFEKSL